MDVHFPTAELNNVIQFRTLSRISGLLQHSSKWAHQFSCFLQYTSGLEVLKSNLYINLNYVTTMLQLHPSLNHYISKVVVYSQRHTSNSCSTLSWIWSHLLNFPAKCIIFKIPSWLFQPFCVVIISFTHMLPTWLLALTMCMCTSIHINFLCVDVLKNNYFGHIQIYFKPI